MIVGITVLTRQAILIVASMGLLLSGVVGCGPPPLASPAFARYQRQRSPAFDRIVQTHAEAGTDRREDLLLLTTWFLDGDPRVAMMCRVRPDGHVTTFGYVYDAENRNP